MQCIDLFTVGKKTANIGILCEDNLDAHVGVMVEKERREATSLSEEMRQVDVSGEMICPSIKLAVQP